MSRVTIIIEDEPPAPPLRVLYGNGEKELSGLDSNQHESVSPRATTRDRQCSWALSAAPWPAAQQQNTRTAVAVKPLCALLAALLSACAAVPHGPEAVATRPGPLSAPARAIPDDDRPERLTLFHYNQRIESHVP